CSCCCFTPAAPARFYTLSLHDALPIFSHLALLRFFGDGVQRHQCSAVSRRGYGKAPETSRFPGPVYRVVRKPGLQGRRRPAKKRSEEHTSELQSRENLVCRLPLEQKK